MHVLHDADRIQARVMELGKALTATHHDRNPLIIGLLGGAFVFLADLVRTLNFDCEIDFWRLASYGSGTRSRGTITEVTPLTVRVAGRHVVLLEDIVDSGRTLAYARDACLRGQALSVTVVALLKKRAAQVPVEHVGFECSSHFVVGYGLDLGGRLRNLPDLYYIMD